MECSWYRKACPDHRDREGDGTHRPFCFPWGDIWGKSAMFKNSLLLVCWTNWSVFKHLLLQQNKMPDLSPNYPLDWDSQSLYTAAILENGGPYRGTESKTTTTEHAHLFVSNLPNNDSDWSVSKYSVKHDRHAAPCIAPRRATHCTALRESRRTGAWFRSCLFMYTLLELFVYQSLYLSTLAGGRVKIRGLLWNQSKSMVHISSCWQTALRK